MKVLFLDFDGPLFPDRIIRFHPSQRKPYPGNVAMPDEVSYWKMDEMSVFMLNFLYNIHPFKTVVSSTWKRFINEKQCNDLFEVNGLQLDLHDNWCTEESNLIRSEQIRLWINDNSPEDYIIIDDCNSGIGLNLKTNGLNHDNIMIIDQEFGIDTYNYRKMTRIVSSW